MNTPSSDALALLLHGDTVVKGEEADGHALSNEVPTRKSNSVLKPKPKFKSVRVSETPLGATSKSTSTTTAEAGPQKAKGLKRTFEESDASSQDATPPVTRRCVLVPRNTDTPTLAQKSAARGKAKTKAAAPRARSAKVTAYLAGSGSSGVAMHPVEETSTVCRMPALDNTKLQCGKSVEDADLKDHIAKHLKDGKWHADHIGRAVKDTETITCGQCHATGARLVFGSAYTLKRHLTDTDFGLKKWICQYCKRPQTRSTQSNMERHYQTCLDYPQNVDKAKPKKTPAKPKKTPAKPKKASK